MLKINSTWKATAVLATVALLMLSFAPAHAQVQPYSEDFDDGKAQGWRIDAKAWEIKGGQLEGFGPGSAIYAEQQWGDLDLGFTITTIGGSMISSFRQSSG